MTIATEYAEYTIELEYDDVPEEVIDYAKKLTLDAIGISIGARSRAESSDSFVDGVDSLADGGEATVFATGERLEPEYAALLNGALIHSLDYDDTHRGASHHPGAPVIPAAIATAETVDRHVSGEELLAAIVAGYEVSCRLGQAINPESHYDRGFHGTATCGTFAATAAAVSSLNLIGLSSLGFIRCWAEQITPPHLSRPFSAGRARASVSLSQSARVAPARAARRPERR